MVHAEAGRTEVVRELIVHGSPLDTQDQVTSKMALYDSHALTFIHCMLMYCIH